jgi:flagellar biosynthetic protein FlhB
MTKQEVKEERRSVDGDPDVKARRFRMAREIALQRIQHAVPKADVIVTNPTHFSVALQYDQDSMRAPKVVAKGADEMAFRIRQIATASGVPMVERPPLARGLYWGVHVGQEIKPEFYEAVAEVLAYVYRLKEAGGKAA